LLSPRLHSGCESATLVREVTSLEVGDDAVHTWLEAFLDPLDLCIQVSTPYLADLNAMRQYKVLACRYISPSFSLL
jgi:hypothetical protein